MAPSLKSIGLALAASSVAAGSSGPKAWVHLKSTEGVDLEALNIGAEYSMDVGDLEATLEYSYNDNKYLPSAVGLQGKLSSSGDTEISMDGRFNMNDQSAEVELTATRGDYELSCELDSSEAKPKAVSLKTSLNLAGRSVELTPSYDCRSQELSVGAVTEIVDNAELEINAKPVDKTGTISIAYKVDDDNTITPSWTIGDDSSSSYEWEHKMSSGATVTTTVTPGDAMAVAWEDPANMGSWTAEANVPFGDVGAASVSFKRDFEF